MNKKYRFTFTNKDSDEIIGQFLADSRDEAIAQAQASGLDVNFFTDSYSDTL